MRASHPDYLDYSFPVEISAGQIASVAVQLNPAVINSSVGNTGWFSQYYPLADANGEFAEVGLETPVNIDLVSLAFVKAEIRFTRRLPCLRWIGQMSEFSGFDAAGECRDRYGRLVGW